MFEPCYLWVIAGLVLWIVEILTPGFFVLGVFGTACLIVAPFASADASFKMQLLVFGVAVGALALGIRPLMMKYFYRREAKMRTNMDALIGKSALVTEDIDYRAGTGSVKIGGEIWRAVTSDETLVPAGQKVTVRKLEGCKVIVEVTIE